MYCVRVVAGDDKYIIFIFKVSTEVTYHHFIFVIRGVVQLAGGDRKSMGMGTGEGKERDCTREQRHNGECEQIPYFLAIMYS